MVIMVKHPTSTKSTQIFLSPHLVARDRSHYLQSHYSTQYCRAEEIRPVWAGVIFNSVSGVILRNKCTYSKESLKSAFFWAKSLYSQLLFTYLQSHVSSMDCMIVCPCSFGYLLTTSLSVE